MTRAGAITKESFEALLAWLDPQRDVAGQKYELIRTRLIKFFVNRGCSDAEDLADITINRVIARLPEISEGYVGDPAYYFYGVARKVYLESRRRKEIATNSFPAPPVAKTNPDTVRECLRICLAALPADQRELVLEYYMNEKQAKINHRKYLAEKLAISANALRLRAHRIRAILEKCVLQCVSS